MSILCTEVWTRYSFRVYVVWGSPGNGMKFCESVQIRGRHQQRIAAVSEKAQAEVSRSFDETSGVIRGVSLICPEQQCKSLDVGKVFLIREGATRPVSSDALEQLPSKKSVAGWSPARVTNYYHMNKQYIIEKISQGETDLKKILGWLKCLPEVESRPKPATFRKGDIVYLHGLQHPAVLVERREDSQWLAILISSTPSEHCLGECGTRFGTSYYTKTLTLLRPGACQFRGSVENLRLLNKVFSQLKKLLSL